MAATLSGALTNIILDPLFIYTFHWGMACAAAATVIGQILTALLSLRYLFRMKAVKIGRKDFRPGMKEEKNLPTPGLTSLIS